MSCTRTETSGADGDWTDPGCSSPVRHENLDLRRPVGTGGRTEDVVVSVQVLQEFQAQATRLSHPNRLSHDDAMQFLDTLPTEAIQELTVDVFRRATTLCQRYQVSYWDAAILAAAHEAGCDAVLSEDLNAEQDYDGMTVINPFAT